MKKIKSIFVCIVALLMLSSCAVKQNGSSKSDTSDFIVENGDVGETYNELTADTTAIMSISSILITKWRISI